MSSERLAGFYCSRCNRMHQQMPDDRMCPNCPDEPLFDLSTEDGRSLAYAAEQEERGRDPTSGLLRALMAGGGTTVGIWVLAAMTLQRDFGSTPLLIILGAMLAGPAAGAGIGIWLYKRARGNLGSGLPSEQERGANETACASCGAVSLEELGPDVYRCRHCGYQGGTGMAELQRRQEVEELRSLPPAERRVRAVDELREAVAALERVAWALQHDRQKLARMRGSGHSSQPLYTPATVMLGLGSDLATAQAALGRAAVLAGRDDLAVDLSAELEPHLQGLVENQSWNWRDDGSELEPARRYVETLLRSLREALMRVATAK